MFDGVGTSRDEEAVRRGAKSLLLGTLLGCMGVCGVTAGVLLAAAPPEPVSAHEVEPLPFELVAEVEPVPNIQAPPPPPRRSAAREEDPSEPTIPQPDDLQSEPQALAETVSTVVAAEASGTADGDPLGEDGGLDGGVLNGTGEACPNGDCAVGGRRVVSVHHTEVQVLRRIPPRYPDAARDLELEEVRCVARITINERGVPEAVAIVDCPQAFHAETERALLKWRFRPATVEGETTAAQFVLRVNYRLR